MYLIILLLEKFEHMKNTGDYYVIVVEDTNLGQIVATATLITEHKFIHSCAKVRYIPAGCLCGFNNIDNKTLKTSQIRKLLINSLIKRLLEDSLIINSLKCTFTHFTYFLFSHLFCFIDGSSVLCVERTGGGGRGQ